MNSPKQVNQAEWHPMEISVKGRWVTAQAVECDDATIVNSGKWVTTARVHDEAWMATELKDPSACLRMLRAIKPRPDVFTFTQLPPGRPAAHEYYWEPESIAIADLSEFNSWWMSLPQETRKNVRRAERHGVSVRVREFDDHLVKELTDLNNSGIIRQGRRYRHFGKSVEQVKKDHSAFVERSDFFCAYHGEELIGYLKLVYRGSIASLLNLFTNDKHNDKRPANALLKAAADRCVEKGIRYLTYGNFNYGKKRDTTITQFKVRHGFQETLVPRYFVPLTLRGKLFIALGLHRGIVGILPNRVLLAGIAARAKWYRFSSWFISRCSSIAERPNRNRQTGRANPPAGSTSL